MKDRFAKNIVLVLAVLLVGTVLIVALFPESGRTSFAREEERLFLEMRSLGFVMMSLQGRIWKDENGNNIPEFLSLAQLASAWREPGNERAYAVLYKGGVLNKPWIVAATKYTGFSPKGPTEATSRVELTETVDFIAWTSHRLAVALPPTTEEREKRFNILAIPVELNNQAKSIASYWYMLEVSSEGNSFFRSPASSWNTMDFSVENIPKNQCDIDHAAAQKNQWQLLFSE